jgi:hypothetical protein
MNGSSPAALAGVTANEHRAMEKPGRYGPRVTKSPLFAKQKYKNRLGRVLRISGVAQLPQSEMINPRNMSADQLGKRLLILPLKVSAQEFTIARYMTLIHCRNMATDRNSVTR